MLPQERHAMACPTGVRHDFCCVMKKQTISNSSSQALCLGSTACGAGTKKVVDARHKAWHDGETAKHRETPTRFHVSVIVSQRQSSEIRILKNAGLGNPPLKGDRLVKARRPARKRSVSR